jgi:lysophospholipase L1-like esterase
MWVATGTPPGRRSLMGDGDTISDMQAWSSIELPDVFTGCHNHIRGCIMSRLTFAGCVLVLSLSLPLAAAQVNDAKDNPAVRKLNRDIPRHQEFLRRIEQNKGAGDVIFLGDSITHGWEGQRAWQEHFGSFKPVNLGIGGDQTGHVLWRITDGHELDNLKPKAAVIMIGTNNTGGHTAEQIAGGIKAIVEELKKQKPDIKILVLGVFPRGSFNDAERSLEQITEGLKPINEELKKETPDIKRLNTLLKGLEQRRGTIPAAKLNKKIGEINAIISKLDDGKTVFYKDIGKEFLDENGGLPGEIMPDYLHLSPKGYDIWGKAIKGDIEKLLK